MGQETRRGTEFADSYAISEFRYPGDARLVILDTPCFHDPESCDKCGSGGYILSDVLKNLEQRR